MTSMADNAPRLDNFYNEMISVYHTFLRLIQAAAFFLHVCYRHMKI